MKLIRFFYMILIVMLVVLLSVTTLTTFAQKSYPDFNELEKQGKELVLMFGSGAKPQETAYAYHATCNMLFDRAEGVRSTMGVVSGSVGGSLEILRGGPVDITGGLSLSVLYQMYNGLDQWKDAAIPNDLRVLAYYITGVAPLVVRADSGVYKASDLIGKEYCFGYPGSSSAAIFEAIFNALDYNVKFYPGGFDDAIQDIKDNKLIGYSETAQEHRLTTSWQEIMYSIPARVISFTDEEVEIVREKAPSVTFRKLPSDYYTEPGHDYPVNTMIFPMVWVCHKDLPEEAVYRMVKSYVEGWGKELKEAFPEIANDDPIDTPLLVSALEGVYVHPGALRYFEEIGREIPDSVIPPEMK